MNLHFSERFAQIEEVSDDNMERLIKESCIYRKTVRGEAIGKLG